MTHVRVHRAPCLPGRLRPTTAVVILHVCVRVHGPVFIALGGGIHRGIARVIRRKAITRRPLNGEPHAPVGDTVGLIASNVLTPLDFPNNHTRYALWHDNDRDA